MEENKTTALAKQMPVTITVGGDYKMVVDSQIVSIVVEKIYRDDGGRTYVVFTKPNNRKLFKKETVSCSAEQFKDRVLKGGLTEVTI